MPDEDSVDSGETVNLRALRRALADLDPAAGAARWLEALVRCGLDRLPLPGRGHTIERWRALAAVAEHDLSLAKLYEGHTDALAILDELGATREAAPGSTWGVWAAEAPQGRALIEGVDEGDAMLGGAKCWCSGAGSASHALLTAWHADGRGPQLVSVQLCQPGLEVSAHAWQAVGMAGSASLDVAFRRARAHPIGGIGDYLSRPGFWQGGAGIAACWYGGALALARRLRESLVQASPSARSGFRLAALGRVDVSLQTTAALLHRCAGWIDAHPTADARAVALRARLCAEDGATLVLAEAGRALGAAPYCRDAGFARTAADLPVFIRQSHAERDLASLGEQVVASPAASWKL